MASRRRHYRYDVDPDTGHFSRQPCHDEASNPTDALRYVAVAMQGARQATYKKPEPPPRRFAPREQGWMNSEPVIRRLKQFEGSVPHMYRCTGGEVTVGVGHAILTASDAVQLNWGQRDSAARPSDSTIELDYFKSLYRKGRKENLEDAEKTFWMHEQ